MLFRSVVMMFGLLTSCTSGDSVLAMTRTSSNPLEAEPVAGTVIVIAGLVNMFVQSSAMQFVISVVGVLVFVGLAAHDTQQIKLIYDESDASDTATKKAVMGALSLYLDFLNLFMLLLQLFGDRR